MSGASPVSDTALLFVVVNVTSLSGCTPQPTPHPSQTAFFPVVHLSWAWDAATDLLDSESRQDRERHPLQSPFGLSTVGPGQWYFSQGLGPGLA